MPFATGPVMFDRTEELYKKVRESPDGEVIMDLDILDFVDSPVSTKHKVYGPANILVKQWPDGGISMMVSIVKKASESEKVYLSEA